MSKKNITDQVKEEEQVLSTIRKRSIDEVNILRVKNEKKRINDINTIKGKPCLQNYSKRQFIKNLFTPQEI